MKILFLGDYSNLHACLASELRLRGHDVTVVSDRGRFMNTHADVQLVRNPGIAGGFRYLFEVMDHLSDWQRYDIVQLINPNFLSLRPGKIKYVFDRLRKQNGAIFLTLASNDYYFVKACYDAKMFRYSEFKVGDRFTKFHESNPLHTYGWISDHNLRWNSYLYEFIDGAMAVLPEYYMAASAILGERCVFTNLPIDLSQLPYSPLDFNRPVKLFIGMKKGMEIQKGTDRLLSIARELEKEMHGEVEVEVASNLSLREYLYRMKDSHIVLDQLYSYSPATNALQAMALGKIAASGAQPEYYEAIGNPENQPIFSLSPLDNDIPEKLKSLILDHERLSQMSRDGRTLVETHNDVRKIADIFLKKWCERISCSSHK